MRSTRYTTLSMIKFSPGEPMVALDSPSRTVPRERSAVLRSRGSGNALQGATPAIHGNPDAVADFYTDKATAIAVGIDAAPLISVFFLWPGFWPLFVTGLSDCGRPLTAGSLRWPGGGGVATATLLAAGSALNSVGALRAREGDISPDVAAVLYYGGLAMVGLAGTVAMAVLLAATCAVTLGFDAFPRWFGWATGVLAVLGLVTPVAFLLSLLFPLWVAVAAVLLMRKPPLTGVDRDERGTARHKPRECRTHRRTSSNLCDRSYNECNRDFERRLDESGMGSDLPAARRP